LLQIGVLIYPMMFDLDLVGPLTFFQRLGDANVFYVARGPAAVTSDLGVSYAADHERPRYSLRSRRTEGHDRGDAR